jgi:hypothetical protein
MRSIDFEWQADGDSGHWEIIAQTKKRPRRKWPRWLWIVLALVVLVSSAAGYIVVRRRYEEANRQITFQIQSLIDLEAQAWAKADRALFLAQHDEASIEWYARQDRCIRAERRQSRDRCWPVLPAKLQTVNLQGDIAWAEVIEGNQPVRRVRFYRRTDQGWKRTAPRIAFWKNAVELYKDRLLIVRYHQRDQPHIDSFLEHIGKAFYDVCATVGCPQDRTFEVDFAVEVPADDLPRIDGTKLTLASPWLSGIPVEGDWSEANLESGMYWLAYMAAAESQRPTDYPFSDSLQSAIVDEYAAWVSTQDPAQAPILGRVIARRGMNALPEVFASLKRSPTLTSFLAQWLSLSPTSTDRAKAFFETLLNVEWEALVAGRKDTFLVLQDSTMADLAPQNQETFDEFQSQDTRPTLPVIEVLAVDMTNPDQVVVAFQTQHPDVLQGQTVFLSRNGDWKHGTPIVSLFPPGSSP